MGRPWDRMQAPHRDTVQEQGSHAHQAAVLHSACMNGGAVACSSKEIQSMPSKSHVLAHLRIWMMPVSKQCVSCQAACWHAARAGAPMVTLLPITVGDTWPCGLCRATCTVAPS